MRKLLFVLSILLMSSFFAHAQKGRNFLAVGVSSNTYMGDLSQGFGKWTASFHLGLKFHRARLINGQFNLSFGTITGQNSQYLNEVSSVSPNRYFSTRVITANYDLQLNVLNRENYAIFLSQGLGFIHYTPEDQFYQHLQDRPETRAANETYSNSAIILPSQIGALYIFPNGYGIAIQGGFLNTVTDYLDNISDWGQDEGNDNIFMGKVQFMIPLN